MLVNSVEVTSVLGEVVSSYSNWQELEVHWNESFPSGHLFSDDLILNQTTYNQKQNTTCNNSGQNVTENCLRSKLNASMDDIENITKCCIEKVIIRTEPTTLGTNATYRTIFYWFSSVSFAFLPLILIATINCFLVNAVRKSQKERKKMTKSQVCKAVWVCVLICVIVCLYVGCKIKINSFR